MLLLQAVQEFLKDSGYNGTRNWKDTAKEVVARIPGAPDHQVGIAPFERLYEAYKAEIDDARKLFDQPSASASTCTLKEVIIYNPTDLLLYLGVPPEHLKIPLATSDRSFMAWKPLEALANKRIDSVSVRRQSLVINKTYITYPFTSTHMQDVLDKLE